MHECVCVFFSGGWRLLAITEPWRVQSNSQGSGLRPHQQEMRGGLRHGHQHLRLHHRPHQPVTDQRNHGKIQQAAHQIAPQAAPGSAVQRETSGNIMIVEWLLGLGRIKKIRHLAVIRLEWMPSICQILPDSLRNLAFEGWKGGFIESGCFIWVWICLHSFHLHIWTLSTFKITF